MNWDGSDRKTEALAVLIVGGLIGLNATMGVAQQQEEPAAPNTPKAAEPEFSKPLSPAKIGEAAPQFTLPGAFGEEFSLRAALENDSIVVLEWIDPACADSATLHRNGALHELHETFKSQGVTWLAICPATDGTGQDAEHARQIAREWELPYPVLLDEEWNVTRAYAVKRSPQFFVIDATGKLIFAGPAFNSEQDPDAAQSLSAMQVV